MPNGIRKQYGSGMADASPNDTFLPWVGEQHGEPRRTHCARTVPVEYDLLVKSCEHLRFLLRVVDDSGGQMSEDQKTNVRVSIERLEAIV